MSDADRRKAFNYKKEELDPIELEINGDTAYAVPKVDGLKLLEFTSIMRSPGLPVGVRAGAIVKWLKTSFGVDVENGEDTSEAYSQFQKIVAKHKLDIEDLADISGFLADTYSARPTESAGRSSTGRTTTGEGSSESSSSGG